MKEKAIQGLALGTILVMVFVVFAGIPMNMGADEEVETPTVELYAGTSDPGFVYKYWDRCKFWTLRFNQY